MAVPFYSPKSVPFESLFPPDLTKEHDPGAGWAIYYAASINASFIVIDMTHGWRITPYFGKVNLSYITDFMGAKMSQLRDTGCCGDDR